jgi:hypothetical protein
MPRGPRKPRLKVKKEKEDGEIDVVRTREVRPSAIAVARLAPPVLVNRPPIPEEAPFMYCVYADTAQRCPLTFKSLNTNASYIVVSDKEKLVFVWEGSNALEADRQLALELALEVMKRDLNVHDATPEDVIHIVEGQEKHILLLEMLRVMSFREADYRSKIARVERSKNLEPNSDIVVGTIERRGDGEFEIMTTGHMSPDEEGRVARINFPPILTASSIIVVQVGEHWDIWISRGAEKDSDLEKDVKAYVTRLIMQRAVNDPDMNAFFAQEYIRIVRQGCERILFRRHFKIFSDFEPPDRSIPWVPPVRHNVDDQPDSAAAQKALYEALNINGTDELLESTETENTVSVDPYLLPVPQFQPVDTNDDDEDNEGERDEEEEEDEEEKEEIAREHEKATEGRKLCTKEMLEYIEHESVQPEDRLRLLEESAMNPRVLMGWQVRNIKYWTHVFSITVLSSD